MLEIKKLLSELKFNGYTEVKNFITDNELSKLRELVDIELKKNNFNYFFLSNSFLNNTLVNNEDYISKFYKLIFEICEIDNVNDFRDNKFYKALRVITGPRNKKESGNFHFDAHLFTILVPIFIPERENAQNGDLVIYPNFRKINSSLIINIFQKIFFQNFISRFFLKKPFFLKIFNGKIVKIKPGNIYIFYGYNTLHANLAINPADIRATLLLHFYDIFKNSILVRLNRRLRLFKENLIIQQNIKKK
jgi:hypothetical protein